MRFTCSRAIAQELTRHRTFSFLMESQRYINYSKERHGGEITFIIPSWDYKYNDNQFEGAEDWNPYMRALNQAESSYFEMIDDGCTPQQARDVLPNATKTELIMTGFASDWRHVFDLRLFEKTGKVAPDMLDLMQKAQKSMQEAGIWEDIMSKHSKFEQYGSEDNL
jgi:thymidylate synthase (FAD)